MAIFRFLLSSPSTSGGEISHDRRIAEDHETDDTELNQRHQVLIVDNSVVPWDKGEQSSSEPRAVLKYAENDVVVLGSSADAVVVAKIVKSDLIVPSNPGNIKRIVTRQSVRSIDLGVATLPANLRT